MKQTYEASNKSTLELYADENSPYTQLDKPATNNPAIFNPENKSIIPTTSEELRLSNQALIAHETLRRLVYLRNMYETDTFPIGGNGEFKLRENPTDEEIQHAAEEVAALTLDKTTSNTLDLQSSIPDNTSFYEPPTVEVASLLVNAAVETHNEGIKALAEATLPSLDGSMAESLSYDLHESFGDTTEEERLEHKSSQLHIDNQEKFKMLHATERIERLKKYTDAELHDLEQDDAQPYDPSEDDD